jgi:hypothetical protein
MARRHICGLALQGTSPLFGLSSTSPNDIKLIAQVVWTSISLSFSFFLANFYTVVTHKKKLGKLLEVSDFSVQLGVGLLVF